MKQKYGRGFSFWLGSLGLLGALAACGGEEKTPAPREPMLPVAHIAGPATLQIGTNGVFDGRESEGSGTLAYRWSLEVPEGSEAELAYVDKEKTAFTPDYGGTYVLSLVVTDEEGESEPAVHEVKVPFPAPTAALSLRPSEAKQFEEIIADGSESSDPYGLPLHYNFRLSKRPSGSSATFTVDGAIARFTPDYPGLYEVSLSVSNGSSESETVKASIEVEALPTQPPVAVVGKDQKVQIGTRAHLNGRGSSDPNFPPLPLTYHWTIVEKPEGSEAELEEADTVAPSFVVDALGVFEIELVVSNGEFDSQPVLSRVEGVEAANARPTVRLVLEGQSDTIFETDTELVFLAEPKDADGDELTVRWDAKVPAESEAELQAGASEFQKVLRLDVPGDYEVTVVADDGKQESEPASLQVTAIGPHQPPVAIPGPDQQLPNGSTAYFDGSASTFHDPRHKDAITYTWSVESRPHGSTQPLIHVGGGPTASLLLDKKGEYIIGLVVHDPKASSEKATLKVTSLNRNPVASAKVDQPCNMEHMTPPEIGDDGPDPESKYGQCTVNASGSTDPDGDPLNYYWSVLDGPTGGNAYFGLNEKPSDNRQVSFFAEVPGTYKVRLLVTDDEGASGEHVLDLTVDP